MKNKATKDVESINSSLESLESMNTAGWYNKWSTDQFKEYLGGEILEIGCGIGNFTNILSSYGTVWAIDINKKYISQTSKRIHGKNRVGIGDVEKGQYFFKSKLFDTIICLNVLEHIKDDSRALENIFNLMKVGGKLILLVPAHPFLYGAIDSAVGHYRRYEKDKLLALMEKHNFKVIKSKKMNFLGGVGWWVTGRLLGKKYVEKSKVGIFNLLAPFFLFFESILEPPLGTSILVIAKKVK